jgi:hypothetical protein
MLSVCIRAVSKEVFICTLGSVTEGSDDGFTGVELIDFLSPSEGQMVRK